MNFLRYSEISQCAVPTAMLREPMHPLAGVKQALEALPACLLPERLAPLKTQILHLRRPEELGRNSAVP